MTPPLTPITHITSTTAASTSTAAMSHLSNWRPPITLNIGDQPPAEFSLQKVSGLTGAVHNAWRASLGTLVRRDWMGAS